MIKSNRFFVSFLCAGLLTLYLPQSHADIYSDRAENAAALDEMQSQPSCSYGQRINEKAVRMLANVAFAVGEIPKNVINTTNDSNVVYGLVGGFIKGMVNAMGRMGTGLADFISLPVPTKPVAYPLYVWDDFDKDTSYGSFFRSDACPPGNDRVIATPDAVSATKNPPAVSVPSRQVLDSTGADNNQTNRKLDTIFKKQMMK